MYIEIYNNRYNWFWHTSGISIRDSIARVWIAQNVKKCFKSCLIYLEILNIWFTLAFLRFSYNFVFLQILSLYFYLQLVFKAKKKIKKQEGTNLLICYRAWMKRSPKSYVLFWAHLTKKIDKIWGIYKKQEVKRKKYRDL